MTIQFLDTDRGYVRHAECTVPIDKQRAAAHYSAMAAEAATEVGADDNARPGYRVPRHERMRNLSTGIVVVLAVVIGAIAACGALWAWRTHAADAEAVPLSSMT